MYQGMIKSLRNCKGNQNCTLPPFRKHFANATTLNNQTSLNVTSESVQRSLDFDVDALAEVLEDFLDIN